MGASASCVCLFAFSRLGAVHQVGRASSGPIGRLDPTGRVDPSQTGIASHANLSTSIAAAGRLAPKFYIAHQLAGQGLANELRLIINWAREPAGRPTPVGSFSSFRATI